jgi:hypothetical protein
MRKELAKEKGNRKQFKAIFSRIGKKTNFKGYSEETILLTRIVDSETGKQVADHLWFGYTSGFINASLAPGDMLVFEARVKEYKKGYVNSKFKMNNSSIDFKLSHPTKIKRIVVKEL